MKTRIKLRFENSVQHTQYISGANFNGAKDNLAWDYVWVNEFGFEEVVENLENNFIFVGVTEKLEDSLKGAAKV